MEKRRTLPARPLKTSSDAGVVITVRRDPLLVAMPADTLSLFVLEAKSFFEMPVGRMLLACAGHDMPRPFTENRIEMGDIDRIAVARLSDSDDMFAFSGAVNRIDIERAFTVGHSQALGERGRIYSPTAPDAGTESAKYVGVWGGIWRSSARAVMQSRARSSVWNRQLRSIRRSPQTKRMASSTGG